MYFDLVIWFHITVSQSPIIFNLSIFKNNLTNLFQRPANANVKSYPLLTFWFKPAFSPSIQFHIRFFYIHIKTGSNDI